MEYVYYAFEFHASNNAFSPLQIYVNQFIII